MLAFRSVLSETILDDPDFDAKPMILLVGQYSTGKTTFIRYLLEEDFPGIRIGPEPTTDRFIAVMYGEDQGSIPGNALVVDAKKQFRALSKLVEFLFAIGLSLLEMPKDGEGGREEWAVKRVELSCR